MTRDRTLRHEFVRHIPERVEPGVLFVSMEFGMVAHACCCGCGEEVTTPLTPTDWKLTYDGETVSLHPSVGNWNLPCRSHYVIKNGRVNWAGDWTKEQVAAERRRDRVAKARHYGTGTIPLDDRASLPEVANRPEENGKSRSGWVKRLLSRIR